MTVGQSIQKARKNAGLTQKELAEKAGLATITLQQYERGVREPKIETIKKIAAVLNVSVADFLDEDAYSMADRIFDAIEEIAESVLQKIRNERENANDPYKYFDAETRKVWIFEMIPTISKKYAVPAELLADNAPKIVENALFSSDRIPIFDGVPLKKLVELRPKHYSLMVDYLDLLNEEGQRVALERVAELTEHPKYRKTVLGWEKAQDNAQTIPEDISPAE